jgi:hypothetical protein
MKRALAAAAGLLLVLLAGGVWAQNTGVNPEVGSVWTYLGATFGAGWAPVQVLTPINFGATGNGISDDRAALQKAIDAAAGRTLYLGPYRYCIGLPGLVVNHAVSIEGATPGWPWDNTKPNYGFVACAPNINMLTFNTDASGSSLRGVFFDAGAAGVNSSGAAITALGTSFLTIDHVVVYNPCIGIDERISNSDRLEHVLIRGTAASYPEGCGGIRVGAGSTGGQLTDLRLNSVTSDMRGDFGLWVQDAGGLQIHGADFLFAKNGTLIKPGFNQSVTWLFADNSALGDTTCQSAVLIDTAAPTAVVTGLSFNGTWSSSAGNGDPALGCLGVGVQIQNTGPSGAVVRGVHFVGHRSYANGREGFLVQPDAFDVTIDASMVCNNSMRTHYTPDEHYAGITLGSGVASVAIRNNRISPSCANAADSDKQTSGIFLAGGNYALTIVGNDLVNSTFGLSGTPPTEFSVIKGNNGVDDQVDNIPAISPLPLALAPTAALTGATGIISNITGMWFGREVYLLARDADQQFAASTGDATRVCNDQLLPLNKMTRAVAVPGANCVYIFAP